MIFKRCKHDKCTCAFWYEFVIKGVRYRQSTRTSNRQIAERVELRRRNAIIDGKPEAIESPSLTTFVRDYLESVKQEHRTANKAERVLEQFKKIIGTQPLDKITPFAIEKWKLGRVKAVSQSTVNRELNVIAGMFSRAVEWGKLTTSPMPRVTKFAVDDVRVRVLTNDEIALIFQHVPESYQLAFRVTLESLPRLSEVLSIRRAHLGPTWVEIRRKGGRVHRIPISASLRTALLTHAGTHDLIFWDMPSSEAVSSYVARLMQGLGLKGVSHHTFRHTGVTWMLEAGKNVRAIQVMAGWSSLRMLQRYGHVRDAELQGAVAANADRLAAIPTPEPTELSTIIMSTKA